MMLHIDATDRRGGTGGIGSIQHDLFHEFRAERGRYRDVEKDAMHDDPSEKVFDDDDMWKVYEERG